MDLFRYKSLECITDSTFQCKGYEAQRVIRSHISFEHFEPKSPGKKIFTVQGFWKWGQGAQCPRIDLNRRLLPRPNTTTA